MQGAQGGVQVPGEASGEVCATGPNSSSLDPSRETVPPSADLNPPPADSSPSASSDAMNEEDGNSYLCRLGVEAALAVEPGALRSEVAKHVAALEYVQRRAARQRRAAAAAAEAPAPPPERLFSLRLSDEEAWEDVAAVSLPPPKEAEAKPEAGSKGACRGAKRRRR